AASRDESLPVLIQSGPEGLTLSSQHEGLAVAYQQPGTFEPQTFVVPGNGLETLAGDSPNPVFLESLCRSDFKVTWLAEGRGWRRTDAQGDADSLSLPPPPPVPYVTNRLPPHGLPALHDALMTASPWHPVWSRIELRGSGVIAATDGKQVLLQTGFNFPWTDDLLVPRTEVFDCVDFDQCEAKIGCTDSHVVILAGGWTIALPIDKQARFPRVESALPPANSYAATWDFSQENVELLLRRLPTEQGGIDNDRPVTLTLTMPFFQARVGGYAAEAELRLPWAHLTGWVEGVPKTGSFVTSRRNFRRALELGFREFIAHHTEGVIQCRDSSRIYAWPGWDAPGHFVVKNNVEAEPSQGKTASTAPASTATGGNEPRQEFPRQAVLARHPITDWLTVFVIKHTGEREEQVLGPDGATPLTEYFEECLKKYGLLSAEQQMEEQRRLAEQMQVSFAWLRGAYTEWLTSCQQFTEDITSETASLTESCGGGIARSLGLPAPTQSQELRPAGFGVLRWWEQAERYRREELQRRRQEQCAGGGSVGHKPGAPATGPAPALALGACVPRSTRSPGALSADVERRQRAARQAEVRVREEERRHWQEYREAQRRQRQEEDARKDIDITFLGHGVSAGLKDPNSDIDKLTAAGLPVLSTPVELAEAIGVTIPQLRWLAYHTSVTSRIHYVSFTVPKKGGGERTLHAPLHLMGRAQRWILENILDKLSVEDPCHGFHPGRGTVTNAAPHAGQAVVINMDLAGFFPSVSFRRVRSVFERLGYSPAVATILGLLCTACPRREEWIGRERRFVAIGPRGLPQGACTSPALANQVTRRLDRRLDGLAKSLGGAYTRYADDLSFSGGEEMLERIGYLMTKVRLIVTEEGFTVNEKKTRVQRRSGAQLVTGLVVNDRPGVVRREVRRLRAILHRARTEGLDRQNREGRENFLAWLHGKIGYVCMARPEAGARLQADLRAILNQETKQGEKTEYAEEEPELQPQGAEVP
ncbi:MAG TPA: reverse transcriptase family protein, partial [Gemmataceae bacterium]|nr:reverse transcriptase family protein [Gemmataceae bacterium]